MIITIKNFFIIAIIAAIAYLVFMQPGDCVKGRVEVGLPADWANIIDCLY